MPRKKKKKEAELSDVTFVYRLVRSADCGTGFHEIYGHCVAILTQFTGTWYDMQNTCFNMDAKMVKMDDGNFMYHLIKFIQEQGKVVQTFVPKTFNSLLKRSFFLLEVKVFSA